MYEALCQVPVVSDEIHTFIRSFSKPYFHIFSSFICTEVLKILCTQYIKSLVILSQYLYFYTLA